MSSHTRPDGTVSSWPMWVLGLAFLVDAIDQNIVRGIVPQLQDAFGVGDIAIGVLMSAFILVNGLVTLPAGYLADRWFRTRMVAMTIAVWSVISAAGSLAPTFGVLVALRGLLGFGQAVTDPSTSSLLPDYYELRRRGRAFSVQQCFTFVGTGLGVLIGGIVGPRLGFRAAFVIVSIPGLVVAALVLRLREPKRGAADRLGAGVADQIEFVPAGEPKRPLFDQGARQFFADLWSGLRADVATIFAIRTLRYALAGVSALLFVVTAVGSWTAVFYERQLGLTQGQATTALLVLVIAGGIPGVVFGGRVADRWASRIRGARVVLPGISLAIATTLFVVSLLRLPFAACFPIQVLGFFFATASIPALRAGFTDAVPATLRGTGFGAFNLATVVFGTAAAPFVTSIFSQAFGDDLRTAFLIVIPLAYVGAGLLLRARNYLEADTQALLEAVTAAARQAGGGDAGGPSHMPGSAADPDADAGGLEDEGDV